MVQIGNFHVGKADTATPAKADIAEAHSLCKYIFLRHDCIEQSDMYYKVAHDDELKAILSKGMKNILEKEIAELEQVMKKYNVPMPSRVPRSVQSFVEENDSSIINDQFILMRLFNGCTQMVHIQTGIITSIVNNDSLRNMFVDFLKEEIEVFGHICKYGKAKGWLPNYPIYKAD